MGVGAFRGEPIGAHGRHFASVTSLSIGMCERPAC